MQDLQDDKIHPHPLTDFEEYFFYNRITISEVTSYSHLNIANNENLGYGTKYYALMRLI